MEKMMRYIDMHCDTVGSALAQKKETFLELDDTMVDGLRLQQAKAGAQFFAMFLPQRNDPDWFGLQEMPPAEELMRKMYAIFCHTMEMQMVEITRDLTLIPSVRLCLRDSRM